jgi:tRNA (cmo5U34)-methyltransferase
VPELLRAAADLVIDGGELPGTPSTVVDLRRYEETGEYSVVRRGLVDEASLERALHPQFHFDPDGYLEMMRAEVPEYDALQDELVSVSGGGARRILELGVGTGETARRLLQRHPGASLVGIDVSEEMLAVARSVLPAGGSALRVGRLEDPLPDGPFDVVASALCIHHLEGRLKADLFERVRAVLAPGGRFVFADLVLPDDPAVDRTPWTPGYDHPSPLSDQLAWLSEAGFAQARVTWRSRDLVVVAATDKVAQP